MVPHEKRGSANLLYGHRWGGQDDTGKKLTIFLQDRGLPAVYVYARMQLLLAKPVVRLANRLLLKTHPSAEYSASTNEKKRLFAGHTVLRRIYQSLLLFDYLIQLLIKVKIPTLCGKLVVCDRYIYDTLITDFAVDMNLSVDQIESLLDTCFAIVPQPNVNFLIDVSEEVAFERKDDHPSKKYLTDRRGIYQQIAKKHNMRVLNGNNDASQVFSDCIDTLKQTLDF
jgi:dTMP kinase